MKEKREREGTDVRESIADLGLVARGERGQGAAAQVQGRVEREDLPQDGREAGDGGRHLEDGVEEGKLLQRVVGAGDGAGELGQVVDDVRAAELAAELGRAEGTAGGQDDGGEGEGLEMHLDGKFFLQ